MEIFIDTANIEEIKQASSLGFITGVTTNPSLIAKEQTALDSVIKEICELVDGPISAEVMGDSVEVMYEEALELAKLHKNIVIKLPMNEQGLKVCKLLTKKKVKTNMTLIFSATQALLAARAGATYVSPFVGRLDDISSDGMQLIRDISDIFVLHNLDCKIISASIRHPMHVLNSALSGANIATIPYKVLKQMINHPLTDVGIAKFEKDFANSK